jgi:hypothetical protein
VGSVAAKLFISNLGGAVSAAGRSGGGLPVHPASQNDFHSPSRPIEGANRLTPSQYRSHSASATRARQAATLQVVDICRLVTNRL